MFDKNELIGLELDEAKKIALEHNDFEISVIVNSKTNEKCNAKIVCAAKLVGKKLELICGEFYVGIKGEYNEKTDGGRNWF